MNRRDFLKGYLDASIYASVHPEPKRTFSTKQLTLTELADRDIFERFAEATLNMLMAPNELWFRALDT